MTEKILLSVNSRYRDTELLKDSETGRLYFGLWESPVDTETTTSLEDIEHVVIATEIGCLDLIAWQYYENEGLWWVIAQRNGIIDPVEEMYEGQIIIVPNPAKVIENER